MFGLKPVYSPAFTEALSWVEGPYFNNKKTANQELFKALSQKYDQSGPQSVRKWHLFVIKLSLELYPRDMTLSLEEDAASFNIC